MSRNESSLPDVRFGHDPRAVQDENGVDLGLLRSNLRLTVEQRLLALEDYLRFVEAMETKAPAR